MQTEIELTPPRHCFSPRQIARAGEIWRLCQEIAVQDSARRGWPPARYLDEGTAFVVAEMAVRHSDEIRYGETLRARTWVRDFRRGILSHREVRLFGPRGLVAAATQRWAHVDASLKPSRAPAALIEAFVPEAHPAHAGEPPVGDPERASAAQGPERSLRFTCWQTWMDPLGHVNHPVYVDWCDEAIARAAAEAGLEPAAIRSVGERVRWRSGATAGESIEVRAQLTGRTASGDALIACEIFGDGGRPLASALAARGMAGESSDTLARALAAPPPTGD